MITEAFFSHFQHFIIAAFSLGIPQNLGALQGNRGVYYTGGLFNFETVELAAQYARALVKEYF